MTMRLSYTLALAFLLAACGQTVSEAPPPEGAQADDASVTRTVTSSDALDSLTVPLINNARDTIGVITIDQNANGGVRLRVQAGPIPAGEHGMHFHEKADCSSSDFKSAGGHINPMNRQHGLENPDGPDNADMENAVANADNNVVLERINTRVSLTGEGGLPALLDANGSALVIHENPDDQKTQPIGGAGARIACAEIRR